jgi:glycosyltransferase involved in cell wall biosynthesis
VKAKVERIFVILTNTDFWDDPPRARHQVAEALSKRHKVYFISTNETGSLKLRKVAVRDNLLVLVPSYPIDYRIRYRVPFINASYQRWIFRELQKETCGKEVIVLNFDNTATCIFDYFDRVVFYCNDYNIRYYYLNSIKRYFEDCERQIASKSILCVGTAGFLVERLRKFNANVLELRLGSPTLETELRYSRNGVVKVGLVGYLAAKRISTDIIEGLLADDRVELRVYGRIESRLTKQLSGRKNVTLRGVLRGRPLLDDLQQIDVGIAPYRIEDVNPGGTPNKLWLYLAVGKPVVISDLPSIRDWVFPEKCVYRADGGGDFVAKVHQAYREDSRELMNVRADFARQNSWDRRIDVLLERIDSTERRMR